MPRKSQTLKKDTQSPKKVWFEQSIFKEPETQEITVNGEQVRFYVGHTDGFHRGKVSMERESSDGKGTVFTCYISSKEVGEAIAATDPEHLRYAEYKNENFGTIRHVHVNG